MTIPRRLRQQPLSAFATGIIKADGEWLNLNNISYASQEDDGIAYTNVMRWITRRTSIRMPNQ
jgi:hypothetical protein